MCETCGCGKPGESARITRLREDGTHEHIHYHEHSHRHGEEEHGHPHHHHYSHSHPHDGEHTHESMDPLGHDHNHDHSHHEGSGRRITLEMDIMAENNLVAAHNRGYFEARRILALNWVSSPGSGKTSILEATIRELKERMTFFIIEGDQQSLLDAERINKTGAAVVQVNTGSGCHLDASMVQRAVRELDMEEGGVLMIENVGNLVCPALFDLGEAYRIVVVSTTEGEDKPLKYPEMFRSSHLCLINKTDLLPYLDADISKLGEYALRVNPGLVIFRISAKTGEGMEKWFDWLIGRMKDEG